MALYHLVVSPLARSRADLTVRYEAALADALADPLTGLGNHRAFQEELDRQVDGAQRYGAPVALVLIDLDDFKSINDTKGHAFGDQALAQFGALVKRGLRKVDRSFRVGGDEFAILLPQTDGEAAKIVIRRLLATALQPAAAQPDRPGQPVLLGRHLGAPRAPPPGGPSCTARPMPPCTPPSGPDAPKWSSSTARSPPTADPNGLGAAVAEVVARAWLRPVYQPIMELKPRRAAGRGGADPARSRRRRSPTPTSLFAAAAASGHLLSLELACVETIVAGAAGLARGQFLSINLSPATLEAPEFSTAALLNILARHSFPPERLVIELTEQQPVTDIEKIRLKLETCRAAGMRVAADDVGSGNAGLRLLAELSFDIIKVDLTLVQRSASSAASSAVVESVVALAGRTGAMVVAEGIEHPEQLEQLDQLGITVGQGFLLGRPGSLPGQEAATVGREALSIDEESPDAGDAGHVAPGASRSACRSPRHRRVRPSGDGPARLPARRDRPPGRRPRPAR